MKKRLICLLTMCLLTFPLLADSPLTSTPFYKAYADEKIVQKAEENGLHKKVLKFLVNEKKDPVLKIAAINAISWGKEGTTKQFEQYMLKKNKELKTEVFDSLRVVPEDAPSETELTKLLTADELMCWTYLQALEDYQNPQYCMRGAYLSFIRKEKSMAHATVFALVACQNQFDYDWCKIYQLGQIYFVDKKYEENILTREATHIILDYLNLYADACQE